MKILAFSPHNGLWAISFPFALVLESLGKLGHEVTYLHCDELYPQFCVTRAGSGVGFWASAEEKARICGICTKNTTLFREDLQLRNGAGLGSYLTASDREEIDELLSTITRENFSRFTYQGVQIGKYSTYELLIQLKKSSFAFSAKEWDFAMAVLRNALATQIAFTKALRSAKPDVCFLDHTMYSNLRACQEAAEQEGVQVYFLCANPFNAAHMFELLLLSKKNMFELVKYANRLWGKHKHIPASASEVALCRDHFLSLFQAKGNVISTARDRSASSIREKFGIAASQRVLLATMSSYDELFAAQVAGYETATENPIFKLQVDWISSLIEYVRARPELFLIVRVHPREMMATDANTFSEHFLLLQKSFKNLPPNAIINWPEQKLSIYNLAEEVDVILNAWSSAGMEMSTLGIPVVIYCPEVQFYPEDMNFVATSRENYFSRIEEALRGGWSFDRLRQGFRWYSILQSRLSISVSDSYPSNTLKQRSFWTRARGKLGSLLFPHYREKLDFSRRKPLLQEAERVSQVLQSGSFNVADLPLKDEAERTDSREKEEIIGALRKMYIELYGELKPPLAKGTLREKLWQAIDLEGPNPA